MRRPEHALQAAVAHMLDVVLDPDKTWWSAIDHGVGKLGVVEATSRKRRGVKRGLPDFILLASVDKKNVAQLIGIELKTDKGRLSPDQVTLANTWVSMGHTVYVARSMEEVQGILEFCCVPMLRRMNFLGGGYERPERPAPSRHRRPKRQRKPKGHLPVVLPRAAQKV